MKATRRTRRDARRLYKACLKGGLLDEGRARQVADRVAKAGRRGCLALLSQFYRLVRLDRARRSAVVESATTLARDIRASVEASLARSHGPGISTSFVENPGLIAGVRVKVGSDVYDGTVRAALSELEERFR